MRNSSKVTAVKAVKGNKFQIELEQVVNKGTINLASLMNEGDDRFTARAAKARKAWMSAEAGSITKYLGIPAETLAAMEVGESLPLSIINPKIGGLDLNIRVLETTEPSEILSNDAEKKAKQIKTDNGEHKYFVKDGKLVYSETSIVAGEPKHVYIADAELVDHIQCSF